MAVFDGGTLSLFSRNGADVTRTFPEISAALPWLSSRSLVLDGEIVALNDEGVPASLGSSSGGHRIADQGLSCCA
jgi:bifunctional non-homologous end joining protein LigD